MIYLDYAADTPADPRVLQRFSEFQTRCPGNPNSLHPAGAAARAALSEVMDSMAQLLGVHASELLCTSGASESNNTAVKGLAFAARSSGRHILTTPLEHASVLGALEALQAQGFTVDTVPVGRNGAVRPDALRSLLRQDTILLCVCAADSELGVFQPLAEIRELLKPYPNCRLHVDATQVIGKVPFSFDCADTVSFSPHKFYGLVGSGLLFKRKNIAMEPLLHGGSEAFPERGGTPAVALAASAEAALSLSLSAMDARLALVRGKNHRLRAALSACPLVHFNSPADALPHILNLSVRGVSGTAFQRALAERGVCVSVKSACSSDGLPSRSVLAVTQDRQLARAAWRISLSHLTTDDELSGFLRAFDACCRTLVR